MTEEQLIRLLRSAEPPPESPEKVRNSVAAVMARLDQSGSFAPGPSRRRWWRLRLCWHCDAASPALMATLIAFAVIAMAAFSITPPGHAVTGWMGRAFSRGEPGGAPSMKVPKDFGRALPESDSASPVVIGIQRLADGTRLEIATRRRSDGAQCFRLDLPGRGSTSTVCPNSQFVNGAQIDNVISTTDERGNPLNLIFGRTTVNASDVAVFIVRSSGHAAGRRSLIRRARLRRVSGPLLKKIGSPPSFNFFVVALSDYDRSHRIEIESRDRSGQVLGTDDLPGAGKELGEAGAVVSADRK